MQAHESDLRAYLRGRFPQLVDVDDLVQETYQRLVRAREKSKATLTRPYLFVVARNAALDLVRRRQKMTVDALEELPASSVVEETPDAADLLSHAEEVALVADALRALPPRCAQIFTLRRIHGLSHREIALQLGITESTVNAQLAIGLMRCRQYLCAHGVQRACIHVPDTSRRSV